MTQTTTPGTDHYLSLFQQRADRFTQVVDAVDVSGGDWDGALAVRRLERPRRRRPRARRPSATSSPRRASTPVRQPDLADPAAAWRAQRAHVTSVLEADGVAAREYDGYFGRTTIAATVADFYGWDLVVHGSDVARATGQEWSVSDAEAADLHATADGWGAALHSEGVCADAVEVGADASVTDRLLARLGRDPGWRPAR